jgi:hypothetical protein
MVVVKIMGGLGNQMFQYAAGRSLSIKNNTELFLDCSFFDNQKLRFFELDLFNIQINKAPPEIINTFFKRDIVSRLVRIVLPANKSIYKERAIGYDPAVEKLNSPSFITGYWQSEKYFKNIEFQIRKDFTFQKLLDNITAELARLIASTESTVSIHFRRGDYSSSKKTNEVHGTCSIEYYEAAMEKIRSLVGSVSYFIFSDEPQWVRQNFAKGRKDMVVVDHNSEKDSWKDMYLMSLCKHNIIANSSFSWWGAWLNSSVDKVVIAPKRWFAKEALQQASDTLVPEQWLRL